MLESLSEAERTRTLDAVAAHEQRLLALGPNLERLLDPGRVRAHVEARLRSARRTERPVPHLVVNEALPPDLYEILEAAWPPKEVFKRDARERKMDLVPSDPDAVLDSRNAGYGLLPGAVRSIWDFFVFVVNRQIVGPMLAGVFEPEIATRLALLRRAHAEGLITYSMAGARDWSYRPNVGRFMVRSNGYRLKPHVDSAPYLVTALHYFPEDDQDAGFGTIFYEPTEPLDFNAYVKDGSTQYFEDAGIDCTEVLRIPYRPNTLLAFANTLVAAHGTVAPDRGHRRVFQYHLSLKGDHEKV